MRSLRFLRSTPLENKLRIQTESAVRRREPGIAKLATSYNNLCTHITTLIRQGKTPRGATAPRPISRDGLFKLDVDDDIWQDLGLDEEDEHAEPPAWLADEPVRKGIRAMLELDRCMEEERRLMEERCFLQEWMMEEWARIRNACAEIGMLTRVS